MPPRRGERHGQRRRHEPPAALVGVAVARLLQFSPHAVELRLMRLRQAVEVEIRDRVVARVVQAADEDRLGRESPGPAATSRSRTRGSLSNLRQARGRSARRSRRRRRRSRRPTRADCSGCSSRARARRPAGRSRWSGRCRAAAARRCSTISSSEKPMWPSSGPGLVSRPLQLQPRLRRRLDESAERLANPRRQPRETAPGPPAESTPARPAPPSGAPRRQTCGCRRAPGATPCPGPGGPWPGGCYASP